MLAKTKQQSPPTNLSNSERKQKLDSLDRQLNFEAMLNKLIIKDVKKQTNKTYTQYTKEKYRTYIENPGRNEKELREMSNFLYRVSMPYRRFINYLSDIPLFFWNLTPQINFTDTNLNKDKILNNYFKILQLVNNMSINYEMRKVLTATIRDGVFYGFIYADKNSFFIHKLDPDYCMINEIESGCYNFAFDFSFFKKYPAYLEYMDPSFAEMYKLYDKDSTNYRWQPIAPERSICIKVDPDTPEPNLPMLVGLFESLLDLIDARGLQRDKDEIQNYKLIALKIPFFDNTKETDDFSIEFDTATRYYNRLADVVPESVGLALTPMDIQTVEFKPDETSASLITSSMNDVFDDSGISQLLFNSNKTGSVGLDASLKVDAAMVWKIVECIEKWISRYISYNASSSNKYFFEILRVDIFNRKNEADRELALATVGVPNKMRLAAVNGENPYQVLSSQIFENDILELHSKWIPLQTSYTLSSDISLGEEPNDEADRNRDANGNKDEV